MKKLEENHDVGRALEPEEEKRVLDAAARNPSKYIYPFPMTLAWTGMRSDEARTLRWEQADFGAGQIIVGKAKTEAGTGRAIPMSGALRAAAEAMPHSALGSWGRFSRSGMFSRYQTALGPWTRASR